MANDTRDIKPRHISDEVWFYPTKGGLEFTVEFRHKETGAHISSKLFTLKRRQLLSAIKAVEKYHGE